MKSISFPDMFNMSNTKLVTDHDATALNLRLLLLSDKNSLFGDPYFGSGLKRFLFELNDSVLRDILVDDIYSSIRSFIPLLSVSRSDIDLSSDGAKIYISIKAINQLNFLTDLYNLVLFDSND